MKIYVRYVPIVPVCSGNPLSEVLRQRLGLPAPRSAVGNIDWRRREKDEHEWVTNSLGFSLRLNKILGDHVLRYNYIYIYDNLN